MNLVMAGIGLLGRDSMDCSAHVGVFLEELLLCLNIRDGRLFRICVAKEDMLDLAMAMMKRRSTKRRGVIFVKLLKRRTLNCFPIQKL